MVFDLDVSCSSRDLYETKKYYGRKNCELSYIIHDSFLWRVFHIISV